MAITQKQQSTYGVEQMITLKGIEAVRTRPGMYVGSVGPDGIKHIILEVVSNSVDEHLVGECNLIIVSINTKSGEISIKDNGRGIPCGVRPDGLEALEAACTELHTGAKFTASGETGYNTSGGMNGVGLKCANGLSEYCIVTSTRDGKIHKMTFNKGIKVDYVVTPAKDSYERGTIVTFKPDIEIFKEGVDIDVDAVKKQLKELSFLNKGLVFTIDVDGIKENIVAENGLLDYLTYLNKNKAITNPFYCESKEGQLGVQVALMYNDSYSDSYKLYTNSIPNSAGTHLTGFRTALTAAINEYAKNKKLIKDENFTGDDLKEGMILALSLIMPDPVFSGQTKDVLTSSEGRGIVQRLVAKEIRIWLEANPTDAKAIINKALLSKKARAAAKRARETTRKKAGGISSVLPGKLADCSSKNPKECEVFIVEGDSAAGTAKTARNRETQAILPVRGKILNTEKTEYSKAMLNEEIKSMIAAFGLQIDEKNHVYYDEKKLRYHKIVILSDADVDGAHIQTLFFTFLWNFAPELIQNGYVYASVPPLYKIVVGKETFYLKDDASLAEYQAKNVGKKYTIQRFKGLGEMDSDELAETVMSKNNRTLKQITIDDMAEARLVISNLMGASVLPRKKFIEENAQIANLDI